MKKVLMMLMAGSLAVFTMSCEKDEEKVISESGLPEAARDFITTHFADQTVTRVVKDTEGATDYDVNLDNGFNLEFNSKGAWTEIEGYGVEIPETILDEIPAGIVTYVETNHSTQAITMLDLNKNSYEIKVTGGVEIIFSLTGEFVRYDD